MSQNQYIKIVQHTLISDSRQTYITEASTISHCK